MSNNKNLISEAKKSYENKNFFDAKSYLLMALKGNKMDKKQRLNIYILISDVSYKTNDFDNAEKYLLKTIEEGKLNSDISNQLGNIYLKKRNYKKAEKSYLKAIDLNEDNEIALINLAILYHNLGKQNEAIFFNSAKAFIAIQLFGENLYNRIVNQKDPFIRKALDAIGAS